VRLEKATAYWHRLRPQIRHSVESAVADVVSTPLPLERPAGLAEPSAPTGADRYSRVEAGVSDGHDDDFDSVGDVPEARRRRRNQYRREACGLEAD
jgi:hypothetical protein